MNEPAAMIAFLEVDRARAVDGAEFVIDGGTVRAV